MSNQAALSHEPKQTSAAGTIPFRLGQRTLQLKLYAKDYWISVEPRGVTVRREGRTWRASLGVGLEYLGPYVEEMALCMARGVGKSREEAEESLNAELEAIRHMIGGPTT